MKISASEPGLINVDECFVYSLKVKVRKNCFGQRNKSRTLEHF